MIGALKSVNLNFCIFIPLYTIYFDEMKCNTKSCIQMIDLLYSVSYHIYIMLKITSIHLH